MTDKINKTGQLHTKDSRQERWLCTSGVWKPNFRGKLLPKMSLIWLIHGHKWRVCFVLSQFVDDVEFWFPPGKKSLVQYRSASRIGLGFDANRKRVKVICLSQILSERSMNAIIVWAFGSFPLYICFQFDTRLLLSYTWQLRPFCQLCTNSFWPIIIIYNLFSQAAYFATCHRNFVHFATCKRCLLIGQLRHWYLIF